MDFAKQMSIIRDSCLATNCNDNKLDFTQSMDIIAVSNALSQYINNRSMFTHQMQSIDILIHLRYMNPQNMNPFG